MGGLLRPKAAEYLSISGHTGQDSMEIRYEKIAR